MLASNDKLANILNRSTVGKADAPLIAEAIEESDALSIADMNTSIGLRPSDKNLTRMHVVKKNGEIESFQYQFNDVKGTFKGNEFVVTFAGTKHWQLTVRGYGEKFWAAYDLITLHRLPYLREATGSMPEASRPRDSEKEAVFTEIKIADVTPERD